LELLSRGAVVDYLTQRLAPNRASEELITDIYRRTDGNALFLVNIVDYLVGHEYLVDQSGVVSSRSPLGGLGLPESLRQLIDLQIEQVGDDDRELVEVASAIGVEFTTDTMAAALGNTVHLAEVEDRCRRLSVETGLIFPDGHAQWPEGPVATRYRFAHALHQ